MFDLADAIQFGQVIMINDVKYIVVKRCGEAANYAIVVKADDTLPAMCYFVKMPDVVS